MTTWNFWGQPFINFYPGVFAGKLERLANQNQLPIQKVFAFSATADWDKYMVGIRHWLRKSGRDLLAELYEPDAGVNVILDINHWIVAGKQKEENPHDFFFINAVRFFYDQGKALTQAEVEKLVKLIHQAAAEAGQVSTEETRLFYRVLLINDTHYPDDNRYCVVFHLEPIRDDHTQTTLPHPTGNGLQIAPDTNHKRPSRSRTAPKRRGQASTIL